MTSEYDQVNLYSFTFVWLPLGMTKFVENCPYGKIVFGIFWIIR